MRIPSQTSFELIKFKKARELFDYISPLNAVWSEGEYIFRGQQDACWGLLPSICRPSFACNTGMRAFEDGTSAHQVHLECAVLRTFLKACDQSGLVVPGYTDAMKQHTNSSSFIERFRANPEMWPDDTYLEVLAAAQHYGIPTRLLDWSTRSFVAAYFAAASSPFEEINPYQELAIWALDVTEAHSWTDVAVIETPGGTSRNQAAQSGVFTVTSADLSHNNFARLGLEEIIAIRHTRRGYGSTLKKLTLPIIESGDLIRLCNAFGVGGATLFPGYYGVAQSVRDWIRLESHIGIGMQWYDQFMNQQE